MLERNMFMRFFWRTSGINTSSTNDTQCMAARATYTYCHLLERLQWDQKAPGMWGPEVQDTAAPQLQEGKKRTVASPGGGVLRLRIRKLTMMPFLTLQRSEQHSTVLHKPSQHHHQHYGDTQHEGEWREVSEVRVCWLGYAGCEEQDGLCCTHAALESCSSTTGCIPPSCPCSQVQTQVRWWTAPDVTRQENMKKGKYVNRTPCCRQQKRNTFKGNKETYISVKCLFFKGFQNTQTLNFHFLCF